MARGRGPGIEDDERYEMLSEEEAARIANAGRQGGPGWKPSAITEGSVRPGWARHASWSAVIYTSILR